MKEMQRQITNLKQLMAIKDKKKNSRKEQVKSSSKDNLFTSNEAINLQRSEGVKTPQDLIDYNRQVNNATSSKHPED